MAARVNPSGTKGREAMGIAPRACALALAIFTLSTTALAIEWSLLSPADDSANSSSIIPMEWDETAVAAPSR